jgi:predicted DNA-binding transcriptional regulator AlpA
MDTTQDQFKIILVTETFSILFGTRSFRPDDLKVSGGTEQMGTTMDCMTIFGKAASHFYDLLRARFYIPIRRFLLPACDLLAIGMTKQPKNVLPQCLPPRGLSREEAAAYVGVSGSLFDALVKDRRMPPAKRINARTVWDRLQLDAAFDALPSNDAPDNPWDKIAA